MTFLGGARFSAKKKERVSPEAHGLYISTFVFQTRPSMKGPGPIQGPGWALGPLFGPEPFIWALGPYLGICLQGTCYIPFLCSYKIDMAICI